jgi:hypothetical protein
MSERITLCEVWGFHGGDILSRGLLVVTPCSDVLGYQRFRCPCCLHIQGEDGGSMDLHLHGVTIQKTST